MGESILKSLIILMSLNGVYLIGKYFYSIRYIKSYFTLYNKYNAVKLTNQPFFHVLIPVLNEEKNIGNLFRSLEKNRLPL